MTSSPLSGENSRYGWTMGVAEVCRMEGGGGWRSSEFGGTCFGTQWKNIAVYATETQSLILSHHINNNQLYHLVIIFIYCKHSQSRHATFLYHLLSPAAALILPSTAPTYLPFWF